MLNFSTPILFKFSHSKFMHESSYKFKRGKLHELTNISSLVFYMSIVLIHYYLWVYFAEIYYTNRAPHYHLYQNQKLFNFPFL